MSKAFEAMKYGPIGEAVTNAMPHTEADPIGVLASTLAVFSSALNGRVIMEGGRPAVVWTVLVGKSALGRKGTAKRTADRILSPSIGGFMHSRTYAGVTSGPSLVNMLYTLEMDSPRSEMGQDGRALIVEEEWSSVLKRSRRCPTFSQQLRSAWDGVPISNTTKKGIQEVARPLLGVHAHITPGEWAKYVSATEALGGSFNRYLPVLVERSKMLPYNHKAKIGETKALSDAYHWALREQRVISFSADAGRRYDELRAIIEDRMAEMPEHLSCYMERSAEQVARVAAIFTASERKTKISRKALEAAWAFVSYSMASVEKLVMDSANASQKAVKTVPDMIREKLEMYGGEATSTLLLRSLGTRVTAASLKAMVADMPDVEMITEKRTAGRGAPSIIFRLVDAQAEEITAEQPKPEAESTTSVRTARKVVEKPTKRKAAAKPRLSVVGATEQPVKASRAGAKKSTAPAKAPAVDPLKDALAALF
ncbi:hypothetical protein ABZ464_02795 [Streptomyces sp. NPDC005820]|uniref:hypothetical protein n=1 Tax=Streptomyces sp. NPDC005820 TaxID=3157069 RepID=UPI0033E7169C